MATVQNMALLTDPGKFHSWTSMVYALRIPVRPSCLAPFDQIPELVNMKAVQARSEPRNFGLDLDTFSLNLPKFSPASHT